MKSKWEKDLATGEELEKEVLEIFKRKHTARKVEGKFKPYDLICDCCGITIECKNEPLAGKTGNFFFSFPLLNGSEAKWLYNKAGDHLYYCELEELRYWVSLGMELGEYREAMGNEGEWGVIVPIKACAFMKRVY